MDLTILGVFVGIVGLILTLAALGKGRFHKILVWIGGIGLITAVSLFAVAILTKSESGPTNNPPTTAAGNPTSTSPGPTTTSGSPPPDGESGPPTSTNPPPATSSPGVQPQPPLVDAVGCRGGTASPGATVTVKVTITSSTATTVGLAIGLYLVGGDGGDMKESDSGDQDFAMISAGQSEHDVSGIIPAGLSRGTYEVNAEIWPPGAVGVDDYIDSHACIQFTVP